MKLHQLILVCCFLGFGCSTGLQESSKDKFTYIAKNGEIIDSINNDSLVEKAIINSTRIIDNKFYVDFSKFFAENKLRYDLSFYYVGHYINSYDSENLPAKVGELFNYEKLISKDTAVLIGYACLYSDNVVFEKFGLLSDIGKLYIYAKRKDCSAIITHMIYKKSCGHFEKLFEIRSTEDIINFTKNNDSIISCRYKIYNESEKSVCDFTYDFKNEKIIK